MTNALIGQLPTARLTEFVGSQQYRARYTRRALSNLIAGRIGSISASGIVVIAWSDHCCTDRGCADAYAYTAAHISSAISAATITRVDASDANTACATNASIC
jgi:hypothetical protein